MIMTEHEKRKTAFYLKTRVGEEPTLILDYSDGWVAFFETEIAALRVANIYGAACNELVKKSPNNGWRVSIRPLHLQK